MLSDFYDYHYADYYVDYADYYVDYDDYYDNYDDYYDIRALKHEHLIAISLRCIKLIFLTHRKSFDWQYKV